MSSTSFTPYLSFRGQAREAMSFYQSIFGGELTIMTFGESGVIDGVDPNEIMHSQLDGEVSLMGADVPASMSLDDGSRISLCFSGDTSSLEESRGHWERLAESGSISAPLDLAPWGDYYGELTDRFGIRWMFDFGTASQEQSSQSQSSQEQSSSSLSSSTTSSSNPLSSHSSLEL